MTHLDEKQVLAILSAITKTLSMNQKEPDAFASGSFLLTSSEL